MIDESLPQNCGMKEDYEVEVAIQEASSER